MIELPGEEGIQEQLEGAKRNKHVYEKIAKQMQVKDSNKTGEQCRAKMKKMKLEYRKIKDNHNKTGRGRKNWKFLEAMDAILGHRPTTRPTVLLDTSEKQDEQESDVGDELEEDEEGGVLSPLAESTSSATPGDTTSSSQDQQTSLPVSKGTDSGESSKPSQVTGRKKRKRTKDDRIEAILTNVVKEVVDAQAHSDGKFLELEEKRMKFEAEQRKEEREFQFRMMSMLYGNPATRLPSSYGSYPNYSGYQ